MNYLAKYKCKFTLGLLQIRDSSINKGGLEEAQAWPESYIYTTDVHLGCTEYFYTGISDLDELHTVMFSV